MEKKRKRYTPSAEELADDHEIVGDSSDEDEVTVTQQDPRQQAVIYQEHQQHQQEEEEQEEEDLKEHTNGRERVHDMENRLELSNMKGRHINDKI